MSEQVATISKMQPNSPVVDLGSAYSYLRVHSPALQGSTVGVKAGATETGTFSDVGVSLTYDSYSTIISLGSSNQYIMLTISPKVNEDITFHVRGI